MMDLGSFEVSSVFSLLRDFEEVMLVLKCVLMFNCLVLLRMQ